MAGTTITIVATGAGRQRAARGPHKRAKEKPGQSRAKENRRLWGCLGLPHEAANGVDRGATEVGNVTGGDSQIRVA